MAEKPGKITQDYTERLDGVNQSIKFIFFLFCLVFFFNWQLTNGQHFNWQLSFVEGFNDNLQKVLLP